MLVDVKTVVPEILVELRYATAHNFVSQKVYDFDVCYLLPQVAERLKLVQGELRALGLGLKIWDGYRPMSAQQRFWEICPDENYVAHPSKGGRHTRGTAVDLTLVELISGRELEMPSDFDDFSERAHLDYNGGSLVSRQNRDLLVQTMAKYDLIAWRNEWWHFDLAGWELYSVIEAFF